MMNDRKMYAIINEQMQEIWLEDMKYRESSSSSDLRFGFEMNQKKSFTQ